MTAPEPEIVQALHIMRKNIQNVPDDDFYGYPDNDPNDDQGQPP